MNCSYCRIEVKPGTAYQKVIGWERPRSAGGTNALALREPQQVFACSRCIDRLKRGIDPEQATLM